jgi:HD-like signal output (HDOD) protein
VWEAVRREWRGPADVAEAARNARKLARETEGAQLDAEEIEAELTNPQQRKFTSKVPLNQLIEVLDVLWQGEGTL